MKIRMIPCGTIAAASIFLALTLGSCSGGDKGPSPLEKQAERISLDLASEVEANPMLLTSAEAGYSDGNLVYKVAFCDSVICVKDYSEALIQYFVAQEIKKRPGKDLDEILNTLSKEQGSLELQLSDVYGDSRTYSISASRLKQLFKQSPMQLNFQEVKANVQQILASRAMYYRDKANATDASFAFQSGFATYTLVFPKASAYSHLKQASLAGRYVALLKPRYESLGSLRQPIEEMLTSLQIEGYRFVYTTSDNKNELRAAIPWRNI